MLVETLLPSEREKAMEGLEGQSKQSQKGLKRFGTTLGSKKLSLLSQKQHKHRKEVVGCSNERAPCPNTGISWCYQINDCYLEKLA